MKMKTAELSGAALDWAVAKCEGREYDGTWVENFSSNWLLSGPIIEREKLDLVWSDNQWASYGARGGREYLYHGPTPPIAAMRCYVASELGEEVDIPEELLK